MIFQEPRIDIINHKKLVGKSIVMSLSSNKTFELWNSFMPERKEIKNRLNEDLISMNIYGITHKFDKYYPDAEFEKWAAAEVSSFENVPANMKTHILEGGLYAAFLHKGNFTAFNSTLQFIFGTWLPESEYEVDKREHFTVMGEKYKNDDPDSEEVIWIPIKARKIA